MATELKGYKKKIIQKKK